MDLKEPIVLRILFADYIRYQVIGNAVTVNVVTAIANVLKIGMLYFDDECRESDKKLTRRTE